MYTRMKIPHQWPCVCVSRVQLTSWVSSSSSFLLDWSPGEWLNYHSTVLNLYSVICIIWWNLLVSISCIVVSYIYISFWFCVGTKVCVCHGDWFTSGGYWLASRGYWLNSRGDWLTVWGLTEKNLDIDRECRCVWGRYLGYHLWGVCISCMILTGENVVCTQKILCVP